MAGINEPVKEGFFHTACPALLSGAAQAILFNPFDRALYVRVKFRRQHFLDRRNFGQPFQGFMNAAVYRTLVGASYMFWQDSARIFIESKTPEYFHASQSPKLNAFLIGAIAGSVNGAVLNGMQVVKYRTWNVDGNVSFLRVALEVYKESGVRIFFRGIGTTALRDCIFGIVYEMFRRSTLIKDVFDPYVILAERASHFLRGDEVPPNSCRVSAGATLPNKNYNHKHTTATTSTNTNTTNNNKDNTDSTGRVALWNQEKCGACAFISNLVAALLASIVSSPFNYARSVIYGAPSGSVPMRCTSLLQSFCYQVRFIYVCGESFTDAKAIAAESARKTPLQTSSSSACSQNWLLGRSKYLWRSLLTGAYWRNRHPVAAWRWVNSRLNIGWGSLRVGLGMAVGQSLFHFLQDTLQRVLIY
ncbi:mitochondrial carrier domain-containing protein [Trypanosoma cruzi]|uniref:Mitochondrial carrier protein n=2 Tax=Trypanosoma cruzi TaxID=5693 RepID=V5BK78_TRYCR|nr:hypothetical protein TCDM_06826 [Trypanosoma cruzi Dm28c]KAF8280649.1 putative mitochondrial carrier protein [Trypanosoma cruzi]PBJ71143.1 hypothetical protein BCY84_17481 [Trypanosoma cruzi cruzi]PWU86637.1 hypothetical protein C4B63_114g26 [Trypanosoma cruzi]RNF16654.1 mitochondrial carrier domain-containing protein [Trypanosoma cruzi]